MKKIYLAIPYSGAEEESYELANKITVLLMNNGFNVFSPITHSHPLSKVGKLPGNWEFWEQIDYQFVDWCDILVVIEHVYKNETKKINYITSTGVTAEVKYAEKQGKKIVYINPDFIDNLKMTPDGKFFYSSNGTTVQ